MWGGLQPDGERGLKPAQLQLAIEFGPELPRIFRANPRRTATCTVSRNSAASLPLNTTSRPSVNLISTA